MKKNYLTREITEADRHPFTSERPEEIRVWNRDGHQTETRIFPRSIHETFCVHPGCRFRGRPAVQGVCHTRDSAADDSYDMAMRHGRELVEFYTKRTPKKDLVGVLSSHIVCIWANGELTLDELVRKRAENAVLKDKLARIKKAKNNRGRRK